MSKGTTWYVVADGGKARILTLEGGEMRTLRHFDNSGHGDTDEDPSAGTSRLKAPKSDPHDRAKAHFAKQVAKRLDEAVRTRTGGHDAKVARVFGSGGRGEIIHPFSRPSLASSGLPSLSRVRRTRWMRPLNPKFADFLAAGHTAHFRVVTPSGRLRPAALAGPRAAARTEAASRRGARRRARAPVHR